MKSFTSTALSIFEHKIEKKDFTAQSPLKAITVKTKDNIVIEFAKPTPINAVALYEVGENVMDFELWASIDGQETMIYHQDLIGKFRFCSISALTTNKITLRIKKLRREKLTSITMQVFDIKNNRAEFRKTCYAVIGCFGEEFDAELLKCYTDMNLISNVKVKESGEIYFNDCSSSVLAKDTKGATNLERVISLIRKNNQQMKIVYTILTESSESFMKAMVNPKFIENINAFIAKFGLDGISFDWEYPRGRKQWKTYDAFIIRLKKGIAPKLVTFAVASWLRYNFSKEAIASIDMLEVMTYDNMQRNIDGQHSPFYGDCANAIKHILKKGFALEQVNIGLPIYARTVDGKPYWANYRDEADKIGHDNNTLYDTYESTMQNKPYTVGERYYNSYQMISDKTAYCVLCGIGGVMIWQLGCDVDYSHEFCLSKAIDNSSKERLK